ncbi:TraV family lipoprotein [Sphingobium estronivorans]|uniref:TraV family lipoprotein n=1 Tax=Sphingobium estronivorans TaxID=1577690 RepID=UPI001F07F9D9|nr:TraV family lipoprotein [Sphingobium estronivorans]
MPVGTGRFARSPALLTAALLLTGCSTIGSVMSPYSEKFSCKNSDHGQCIHPDKAYADAVAGVPSRSDPAVTRDKALLKPSDSVASGTTANRGKAGPSPYLGYRDSVYRELQGLVDAPVTPMLRPGRTVRTLILPYADRERPDRLYMPRYVYSILERPVWVVGDYLVSPVQPAMRVPVLEQVRDKGSVDRAVEGEPAAPEEARP